MPIELELDEIAVFGRPAFHGSESRGALAHFFESLRDVVIGDVHGRHFELEIFVVSQLKFGKHLEYRAELERLPFDEIELLDLRLGNGGEFLLGDGFLDALGARAIAGLRL